MLILSSRLHVLVAVEPGVQFFQSLLIYQPCLFKSGEKSVQLISFSVSVNGANDLHCLFNKICIFRFNRSRGLNDFDDEVACKVNFILGKQNNTTCRNYFHFNGFFMSLLYTRSTSAISRVQEFKNFVVRLRCSKQSKHSCILSTISDLPEIALFLSLSLWLFFILFRP